VGPLRAPAQDHRQRRPLRLAFQVHADPGDPTRLLVYERWASLAALEAHLRTAETTRLRQDLKSCIIGVPEFDVLAPVGAVA